MHLKCKYCFLACYLMLCSPLALSENIQSLLLFYDEVEKSTGSQNMRYIINKNFLRIDNGNDNADYILFNVSEKNIYSVNHEDRTILTIKNSSWHQPEFDFKVSIKQSVIEDAPKVLNKNVVNYSVEADGKLCTNVFLVKQAYPDEMEVMYQYQQVLSGQQVSTLKNTPLEFRTPCFLVDQVYHTGAYFKQGLPLQITYSRDYTKLLKDFKKAEMNKNLFKLPEKYSKYGSHIE